MNGFSQNGARLCAFNDQEKKPPIQLLRKIGAAVIN
jgi:hypothetical protein